MKMQFGLGQFVGLRQELKGKIGQYELLIGAQVEKSLIKKKIKNHERF